MERQFFPATDACVLALDIVWKALTELGLTGGKSKPLVGTFTGPIDCPALGMFRPEVATVYANANDAEKLASISTVRPSPNILRVGLWEIAAVFWFFVC